MAKNRYAHLLFFWMPIDSQGIGLAYEAIKFGKQKAMIAGSAEERCVTQAAVFDTLFATSVKNDTPTQTPSPFDKDRMVS